MALLMRRLFLVLALCTMPAAVVAEVSKEYQIKAAFLYNFVKFAEWPASALGPRAGIVLGTFCDAEFAAELAAIVRGRDVGGHAITVRAMATPEDAQSVHLVFVCTSQQAQFDRIRTATQGMPVLLVGEDAAAIATGAAITFVRVEDKVRFEINSAAADRAGIKLSAQLQKLATAVRK
jgi:hypothetical protein